MNVLITNLKPGTRLVAAWQSKMAFGGVFKPLAVWTHHEGDQAERYVGNMADGGHNIVRASLEGYETFEVDYPATEELVTVEIIYKKK